MRTESHGPARRPLAACLLALLLAALVFVTTPAEASAHPGHGAKVVLGTLKEVARDAIVVEVVDAGGGGTANVRVKLEPDTRFRIDKERLTSLEGMIGQRAIVSVDWEDDDRGGQILKATEVRFTRAKKK